MRIRTFARVCVKIIVTFVLIACWVWGTLALYFNAAETTYLKIIVSALFFLLPLSILFFKSRIKGYGICLAAFCILLFWWQTIEPNNSKDWAADVLKISHGSIKDDILTMHNVRNFKYSSETDFEPRWETRSYDLSQLQGLDIFMSYWASDHIAHTIMSWDFGSDTHLAISIETRKDKTQAYSAIKGFFKQFELAYVAADELDIIKLRTNYRKERVYLYQLEVKPATSRALLESYLMAMNELVQAPRFYNAYNQNCTTTIHLHSSAIAPESSATLDWRLLASGHLDELLYERGLTRQDLEFNDLRTKSRVDLHMQQTSGLMYSREMREFISQ